MNSDSSGDPKGFQSTHWSLVSLARADDPQLRHQAIDQLLQAYYPLLRAHLVMRMRLDEHWADDVLQGFVCQKILARDLMARADRNKGRLRSLLLKSLENFVRSELVRQRRSAVTRDIDDDGDAAPVLHPPSDAFDVAWARSILSEALSRMWRQCRETGREQTWALLEARVLQPILHRPSVGYEELVRRFEFSSPQEAFNALMTAKRQFKRTLEEVIAESVESKEEVESELADLREILSRAPLSDCADLLRAASSARLSPQAESTSSLTFDDCSDPSFLARLIAIQTERESLWHDEDFQALLRHQLDAPLGPSLPSVKAGLDASNTNITFNEIVADTSPDLKMLRSVKRAARRALGDAASGIPDEIASVLYFGSIALALVRHKERITKSGDDAVCYGLEFMIQQSWMAESLRKLFREALSRLKS